MSYKFKGYDWKELAECWGITVKEKPIVVKVVGKDDPCQLGTMPEKIVIRKRINNTDMTFVTEDEEEVLAEKVKRHIMSNINSEGEFKDKHMRKDIDNFLKALIKESKELDFNYPVYEGMLKIKDDLTLAQWICHCLEKLWT